MDKKFLFCFLLLSLFLSAQSFGSKKKKKPSITINSIGAPRLGFQPSLSRNNNPLISSKGNLGSSIAAGMAAGAAGGLVGGYAGGQLSKMGEHAMMSEMGYSDRAIRRHFRKKYLRDKRKKKSRHHGSRYNDDEEDREIDDDEDEGDEGEEILEIWNTYCGELKRPEFAKINCYGNPLFMTCDATCYPGYHFKRNRNKQIPTKVSRNCWIFSAKWSKSKGYPICRKKMYRNSCNPEELQECSTDLLNLAAPEIYSFSERGRAKLCRKMDRSFACLKNYMRICFRKQDDMLFEMSVSEYKELFELMCGEKFNYAKGILKHKECFQNTSDNRQMCLRTYYYQMAQVKGTAVNSTKSLKETCCLNDFYKQCVRNAIKFNCSQDVVALVDKVYGVSFPSIEKCKGVCGNDVLSS